MPSTPTRSLNDKQGNDLSVDESFVNANNKRVMSSPTTPSHGDRALKKARTLPQPNILGASPSTPLGSVGPALDVFPRTPKTPTNNKRGVVASVHVPPAAAAIVPRPTSSPLSSPPPSGSSPKKAVPTLLELLASSKKRNKYSSKSSKGKAKESLPPPPPPIPEPQEEEEEEVPRDEPLDNAPTNDVAPSVEPAAVATVFPEAETDPFYTSVDIPGLFPVAEETPLFLDDPILNISPTKSLSSLAGSDSEDDEIEQDELADPDLIGFSFRPQATSTQRGPFAASGSGSGPGSNGNGYLNAIASGSGKGVKPIAHGGDVNDQQPGLTQMTKDSWESIYAPSGDPEHASAPRSHPSHPSVPSSAGAGAADADMSVPAISASPANHYVYNYSSQFNNGVAKNVDDVDRLLQQDVELAYSGWIRDPYADDEDDNRMPDSSP